VNCNDWNAAITALVTGSTTRFETDEIRAHADRCPTCRGRRDALLLGSAPPPRSSDLATEVVKAARRLDRAAVAPLLRGALVITAAVTLAVHLPELVRGGSHDVAEHVARHAAVCPVAFAVALGVVALRPSRARGLLPVTAALAAALVLTAAIDISRGITPIMAETDHLTEVIGAALVWLTARRISHPKDLHPRSSGHLHVARS
jgi:predicted anti-sigma-YlaC factor YlaD